LDIRFSREAHAWLTGVHGAVTLRISRRLGCCGGAAGVPVAEPGPPASASAWERYEIAGITVYVAPELAANQTYLIRAEGFWRFRRLFVEGASLTPGKE